MAVAFLIWGSLYNVVVFRVTQDGTASREDPKERQATSGLWYSDPYPETLCAEGSTLPLTSVTPHPRTAESMRPAALSPKAGTCVLGKAASVGPDIRAAPRQLLCPSAVCRGLW